jgi:peptidoglycan/LPS O-acetylase OafA/YrhL
MTTRNAETAAATKPAHAPTRQLHALTSLRYFAAMMVVLFHYKGPLFIDNGWQTPRLIEIGYVGVTFFFVLSGFILAYTYAQTDFSQRANRVRYFQARVARIYPVYVVSLVISLPFFVAEFVRHGRPELEVYELLSPVLAPLALHAWLPGAACALNCPSWSISNEFFFYAILPIVLGSMLKWHWRWVVAVVAGLCLAGAAANAVWVQFGGGSLSGPDAEQSAAVVLVKQFVKMFPPLRMFEFLLGIMVYAFWRRHRERLSTPLVALAALAAAAVMFANLEGIPEPLLHNGITALVWVPIILAGAQLRSGPLASPRLVYCGKISFALYLMHGPVLSIAKSTDKYVLDGALFATPWLGGIAAVAAAMLAASFMFHAVEEPVRRRIMRMSISFRAMPGLARGVAP